MAVIVLTVAGILLVRKERASAIFVVVTALGGGILNTGLKMLFARARPASQLPDGIHSRAATR